MKINDILEKLCELAPNAVFTKAEAVAKVKQICSDILNDETTSEYEEAILNDLDISIVDFDNQGEEYDIYLDGDVKFVTFGDIQDVVNFNICQLEANEERYCNLDCE